jgi:hypothetical protein
MPKITAVESDGEQEEAGVQPPTTEEVVGEAEKPELTEEEKVALLGTMKTVKEDLAKQMIALTSELARIQDAVKEMKLGKNGDANALEEIAAKIQRVDDMSAPANQVKKTKKASVSTSGVRRRGKNSRKPQRYSDLAFEAQGSPRYDDQDIGFEGLPENGEGIEYNTKTTRLDLDNPSSTHQKFIFFFYISVLGFIAYQLHQIFYFDEYPNYEANEEDESYY